MQVCLKFFSGKISCFLASNFVSLAEPTTPFQNDSFESVIVGYILLLESYETAFFNSSFIYLLKEKYFKNNIFFSVLN